MTKIGSLSAENKPHSRSQQLHLFCNQYK